MNVPRRGEGRWGIVGSVRTRPAGPVHPASVHAERLREALAARSVITQAEGVLMSRYRVSAAAAHQMLRGISRRIGCPLRQVASEVLMPTGDLSAVAAAPLVGRRSDPSREDGDVTSVVDLPVPLIALLTRAERKCSQVSPRQPDGTVHIRAEGEWNRSTVDLIRGMFNQVAGQQPTLVIVDLAAVAVMDRAALTALRAAHRELALAGCLLDVQNTPPHLEPLLEDL